MRSTQYIATIYGVSPQGWITKWLQKLFFKSIPQAQTVLLLFDDILHIIHQRLLRLQQKISEIMLFCLTPHAIH